MIGLLQRVAEASVTIDREVVGAIGPGLLVLVGVERDDTEAQAERLIERILSYRVFADPQGHMNLSVVDVAGSVLLVPQFTLAADTTKGTRPGFSPAARPEEGRRLFHYFLDLARSKHASVHAGRFAADMKVALINDGPVTFWLQAKPENGARSNC